MPLVCFVFLRINEKGFQVGGLREDLGSKNWEDHGAKMNNKCSSHMYSTVRDHVEGSRKTTTSN